MQVPPSPSLTSTLYINVIKTLANLAFVCMDIGSRRLTAALTLHAHDALRKERDEHQQSLRTGKGPRPDTDGDGDNRAEAEGEIQPPTSVVVRRISTKENHQKQDDSQSSPSSSSLSNSATTALVLVAAAAGCSVRDPDGGLRVPCATARYPRARWLPAALKWHVSLLLQCPAQAALDLLMERPDLQSLVVSADNDNDVSLPHPQSRLGQRLTAAALGLRTLAHSSPRPQWEGADEDKGVVLEVARLLADMAGRDDLVTAILMEQQAHYHSPTAPSSTAHAAVMVEAIKDMLRTLRSAAIEESEGRDLPLAMGIHAHLQGRGLASRFLRTLPTAPTPSIETALRLALLSSDRVEDDDVAWAEMVSGSLWRRDRLHIKAFGGIRRSPMLGSLPLPEYIPPPAVALFSSLGGQTTSQPVHTRVHALALALDSLQRTAASHRHPVLMCDRLEEWSARRVSLEHDVIEGAGAATAAGGRGVGGRGRVDAVCPPLTLLKSARHGLPGELPTGTAVVATTAPRSLLPAGWVAEIGGGKGQWDRVSGYWRFSDHWRPGDAMFSSSGAPAARAVFLDLSKQSVALEAVGGYRSPNPSIHSNPSLSPGDGEKNGSSSEEKKASSGQPEGSSGHAWAAFDEQPALNPPPPLSKTMLTLETSTSPPADDVTDEHDKVKALVDVVFTHADHSHSPSAGVVEHATVGASTRLVDSLRSGPALRCAAPRGGPLDVGCYHTDRRRCRFTAELYVAFDPLPSTTTEGPMLGSSVNSRPFHVLVCRVFGSPANGHHWQHQPLTMPKHPPSPKPTPTPPPQAQPPPPPLSQPSLPPSQPKVAAGISISSASSSPKLSPQLSTIPVPAFAASFSSIIPLPPSLSLPPPLPGVSLAPPRISAVPLLAPVPVPVTLPSSSSSAASSSSVLAKRLAKVNKEKADKAAAATALALASPPPIAASTPTTTVVTADIATATLPTLIAASATSAATPTTTTTTTTTTGIAVTGIAVTEHPPPSRAVLSHASLGLSSSPTGGGGADPVMWCLYVDADGSLCWMTGDPSTSSLTSMAAVAVAPTTNQKSGGGGGGDNVNKQPVVVRSLPGVIPTVAQQPSLTASAPLTASNKSHEKSLGQDQDDAADSEEGETRGQKLGSPPSGHSWVHVAMVLDSSPDDDDDEDDDDIMAAAAEGSQRQVDMAGGDATSVMSLPLRVTLYVDHKQVYPHPHSQADIGASPLMQLRKLPRLV